MCTTFIALLESSWKPGAWKPESWKPESWKPESWKPESWRPESWRPGSWRPETGRPGTAARTGLTIFAAISDLPLIIDPFDSSLFTLHSSLFTLHFSLSRNSAESVMTELAPHASYEKPCTGGPPWPPRFPTPYSAFSAEFLALVTALRSGAVRRSSLITSLRLSSCRGLIRSARPRAGRSDWQCPGAD